MRSKKMRLRETRQEEKQSMVGVPTRNGLSRHPIRSAIFCFGNVELAYLMRAANGMANVDALDALPGGRKVRECETDETPASQLTAAAAWRKKSLAKYVLVWG